MIPNVRKEVEIPEGVNVEIKEGVVRVEGKRGKLERVLYHPKIKIEKVENKIILECEFARKKEAALVGTFAAHIKNMIKGVTEGFVYKMKIVYSHFPINVKVEPGKVLIENFIGERSPRIAKIVGDVKVIVKGDDIEVQGLNIEEVSQTAANIEQATKIKKKDPRVFLDGIYIYEKTEGMSG